MPKEGEKKAAGVKRKKGDDDGKKEMEGEPVVKKSSFTPSDEIRALIDADCKPGPTSNARSWDEVLSAPSASLRSFFDKIGEVFMCTVCQDLATPAVTTPCSHNLCLGCYKRCKEMGKKSEDGKKVVECPACRADLGGQLGVNVRLVAVLKKLIPTYDQSL